MKVLARLQSWEGLLLVLLAIVVSFNLASSPYYLGVDNIVNLFQLSVEKIIIALVMTLIIISGEIDLSVASIMGLAACVMARLFELGVPLPVGILAAIAAGALAGLNNGLWISLCRPAFARRNSRWPDRLSRNRANPGRGPLDRQLSRLVRRDRTGGADRPANSFDPHLLCPLRSLRRHPEPLGSRPTGLRNGEQSRGGALFGGTGQAS